MENQQAELKEEYTTVKKTLKNDIEKHKAMHAKHLESMEERIMRQTKEEIMNKLGKALVQTIISEPKKEKTPEK
jgi:hypothetical protein